MPEETVLIVEDEDSIRLSLRNYLSKKGYNVLVASDGVGAIKHLLDRDVQVIVTDYRMDILGGDYWVRFLKKYVSEACVIVTSGFLQPEFEIQFPMVQKPYEYAAMEKRIRDMLDAKSRS